MQLKSQDKRKRREFVTSRIRSIGNSKGVILNNSLLKAAGIEPEQEIIIHAEEGAIIIAQQVHENVNTDLSTWSDAFKKAKKSGKKPEKDLMEGIANTFDSIEW